VERIEPLRLPILQADGLAGGPLATAPSVGIGTATLLARQVLRDGEIVILILKPSRWSIVLNSLRWAAAILIAAIAAHIYNPRFTHVYAEVAAWAVAARVMWATLQWMGRVYVLTDQRIVRIGGVYNVEIFECPLRKVGKIRRLGSFRERVMRLGSVEIMPEDETRPCAVWQSIRKPADVLEQIQKAVRRAKQGGCLW
jgi:hypothetical protein